MSMPDGWDPVVAEAIGEIKAASAVGSRSAVGSSYQGTVSVNVYQVYSCRCCGPG